MPRAGSHRPFGDGDISMKDAQRGGETRLELMSSNFHLFHIFLFSEQRGGALWNSMQGKEVKREDSRVGLKRQDSRNGAGMKRQDSQRGIQRQDSRTGSLQRQDSRSNGMKFSPKEREPYQGNNNWKDSLRGASPTKPVWERSTASSRAKQSNGEAYVPRKTSTARNNSSARRSRSDSVTRR